MRRLTRRRLLQGAAIASAGLALGARWPAPTAAASDATGWIALTRGRDLVLTRPDGSDTRLLLSGAMGEFVFDVTLSPDGTRLVYGLFTSPSSGAGGADLMMLTVVPEVGQPTLLVSRDGPGVLLGAPCWTPDGRAVVFEAVGVTTRGLPAIRSDMVNADGSGRQTLVESGRYPAVSPDGTTLTYVRSLPLGDTLWTRPLGGGPEREIVSDADMAGISYPRFSPDGSQIAFSGINLAARVEPDDAPMLLRAPLSGTPSLRGPFAHGLPTDPWMVGADGSGLRRFVQLSGDDLAVAWSPDGSRLAVSGAYGTLVFSVVDGSSRVVSEDSTFGGIDWR